MKTTLIKLLAICGVATLLLPACKKTDTLVTSNGGQAGALTTNAGTTLVLQKAKVADTTKVVTFSFTNANYGFSASVTNTLQIDATSDNWKNPVSYTLSNKQLSQGFSTLDFDNLLLKLNLTGGVASTIQVRISQAVSGSVTTYTNVLSMTVTPFYLTSWIYAVGAFEGWNAAAPDSLLSATSNGIYVGIINFPAGAGNNEFLILPAKNFNNKYATTQTTAPTSTVAYNAANNLKAPATAGQYLVTYNMNLGTISFQLADSYSIIGDGAVDWNTDVPMKYINDANGTWVVSTTLNTTGAFKVRQDNAWTFSWGIPQAGSEGAGVTNTLNDTKNDNITVKAAGTYKISFIAPATVIGASPATPPPVTTTYSAVKTN